jgi:hypothetical protein
MLPIEVLPVIYRYGYAMPFYNVSRGIRSIIFGTKNTRTFVLVTPNSSLIYDRKPVGLNFGVLIAWIAISCIALVMIQWFVRRRAVIAEKKGKQTHEMSAPMVVVGEGERARGGST